ncbi:MAG: hypothetical protein K2W78_08605 [Xanthobacteraceae bacterium]|nr:hypothetical protein [Xanthobacteraceae bacterium]
MKDWRISTFNGVLLAAYFVPTWTLAALKIAASPVSGFFDRSNIALAMFGSDQLFLSPAQMIRFSWLLALSKFVVAAFFLVFLLVVVRDALVRKGGIGETLGFALGLGGIISFASLLAASYVHEVDATRLHATEFLLLAGGAIMLLVEDIAAQAKQDDTSLLGGDIASRSETA